MSEAIEIRHSRPEDAETIARFNAAMAWETERTELDLPTVRRGVAGVFADSSNGFYVVATSNDDVVGSLLVTYEWSDWRNGRFWWVQSVYVQPEVRRCGIFRRLCQFVRDEATQRPDVCGLRLYVEHENHRAQRCYQQLGWEEIPYKMFEDMASR
jgi:ribosomal protein S18 acetylase RimI-like enzyme